MRRISESELLLNTDGSIYHLNLLPHDVAEIIILLNDSEMLAQASRLFDTIEIRKVKGQHVTHTGLIGGQRVTMLSTGSGSQNMEVVLNELDALVNIDFEKREERKDKVKLKLIHIGLSASIQENVAAGSLLLSEFAVGLDNMMEYYAQSLSLEEEHFKRSVENHFEGMFNTHPYVASADAGLLATFSPTIKKGISLTTPGFYAAQGRRLRARSAVDNIIKGFQNFNYSNKHLTNLDTEVAGLYALARSLNHAALAVNCIVFNQLTGVAAASTNTLFEEALIRVKEKILF